MPKKCIVVGGGIAGLTTAYLLNAKGFDVDLYEASDACGGAAKTWRIDGYPCEHSLRVYHENYYYLYDLLKQIPFNDKKSIFDNLVETTALINDNYTNFQHVIYKKDSILEDLRILNQLTK
ncbi:MAG: oleate hydratase, partial [Pseudomonadota bacterium]